MSDTHYGNIEIERFRRWVMTRMLKYGRQSVIDIRNACINRENSFHEALDIDNAIRKHLDALVQLGKLTRDGNYYGHE